MNKPQHADPDLSDIDPSDGEALLDWLEGAQSNQPGTQVLLDAVGMALQRKNQLIIILGENLMESDCDCEGCTRMRAVILRELDMQTFTVASPVPVDAGTRMKCANTKQ